MGGWGSGRWPLGYRKKRTVEESWPLSVATLADGISHGPPYVGSVKWTQGGQDCGNIGYRILDGGGGGIVAQLAYSITQGGAKTDFDYSVPITWARAGFGPERPFFLCPRCGRRVAKLYMPPAGGRFLCRTCHGLTYQSCQDSHKWDSLFKRAGIDPWLGRAMTRRWARE